MGTHRAPVEASFGFDGFEVVDVEAESFDDLWVEALGWDVLPASARVSTDASPSATMDNTDMRKRGTKFISLSCFEKLNRPRRVGGPLLLPAAVCTAPSHAAERPQLKARSAAVKVSPEDGCGLRFSDVQHALRASDRDHIETLARIGDQPAAR